jgi:hypothetical protein
MAAGGGCDCGSYIYEEGHHCFEECGGGGDTLSDDQWYEQEIKAKPDKYDTGISKAQWIAWRSFWDDASKTFRSENVDENGEPVQGTGFEKPTDCPDGTTKYGRDKCLALDDPRVLGVPGPRSGGAAAGGGGGGGGGGTGTAAKPASLAKDQLQYTGNELQDVLAQMFNFRAGVFGTGNPYLASATPRTPKGEEIKATMLPTGGVWWGESTALTDALAPFAQTFGGGGGGGVFAAPQQQPKKKKKKAEEEAAAPGQQASIPRQVAPPVRYSSPLEQALAGTPYLMV